MKNIYWYSDPAHAWAKVSRNEIVALGLLDKISGFSYCNADYFFLEEDNDAYLYIKALKKENPRLKINHVNTSTSNRFSRIRSYPHYVNKNFKGYI